MPNIMRRNTKKEKRGRRCALYSRVSTYKQAQVEDGSLDAQSAILRRRVDYETEEHPETPWVIADEYREEGASAKNLDRPAFKRLMADIEDGKVDVILVAKLDRISRSIRDFYDLIEFFNKYGVEFVSLKEKFDTTTAIGEFQMNLHLSIAQLERKQTGERTAATMSYRASKGLPNGGRILGYEPDPKRKGHMKVVPEQAEIVREQIFEKCVDLGAACAVHRHLMKMGIKRPVYTSRRGNKQGGTPYNVPAVIRILTNKKYIGLIEYDGETYQGQHEPIVDKKLFDKVQAILARNLELPNSNRKSKAHTFLLQGLIRCGRCGSMMTPRWSTGQSGERYFYYECVKRAKSQRQECGVRYLPAKAAESFVLDRMKEAVVNEDEIQYIIEKANKLRSTTVVKINRDIRDTKKSLKEVEIKIDNILTVVENGGDFAPLKERMSGLEAQRKALADDIQILELKRDKTEASILSAEVVTREYASVPKIVDELIATKKWNRLKALLRQYVEAVEWTQDTEDDTKSVMKIMLFEHAQPIKDENASLSRDASRITVGDPSGT